MSDRLSIQCVAKLCKSQEGITAAYKHGFHLQEKGWMRFPAAAWDKPAVLAFAGEKCVAGINYSVDEDEDFAYISFAFCDPESPQAFSVVLLKFRSIIRGTNASYVGFTCHLGNEQMMKAVRVLGLQPHSLSFRMPVPMGSNSGRAA